jgi:hypothetical protein
MDLLQRLGVGVFAGGLVGMLGLPTGGQTTQDARHWHPVDTKVELISALGREGTHRPRQREGPLGLRHFLSCEASRKPGHRQ